MWLISHLRYSGKKERAGLRMGNDHKILNDPRTRRKGLRSNSHGKRATSKPPKEGCFSDPDWECRDGRFGDLIIHGRNALECKLLKREAHEGSQQDSCLLHVKN